MIIEGLEEPEWNGQREQSVNNGIDTCSKLTNRIEKGNNRVRGSHRLVSTPDPSPFYESVHGEDSSPHTDS